MNRRKSLTIIGCLSSPIILPSALSSSKSASWMPLFWERWKISKRYTFEVLEAMPESGFDFQPASRMMSFGKIFTHIGVGLGIYAEILDGKTYEKEPDIIGKSVVLSYLERCFEHFNKACKKLKKTELYTKKHHFPEEEPWKDFTITDILLLAYNHTIHHRAQATTYLRLKEIAPPKYRF